MLLCLWTCGCLLQYVSGACNLSARSNNMQDQDLKPVENSSLYILSASRHQFRVPYNKQDGNLSNYGPPSKIAKLPYSPNIDFMVKVSSSHQIWTIRHILLICNHVAFVHHSRLDNNLASPSNLSLDRLEELFAIQSREGPLPINWLNQWHCRYTNVAFVCNPVLLPNAWTSLYPFALLVNNMRAYYYYARVF